jgi:acetone carboxylase gamma subunit
MRRLQNKILFMTLCVLCLIDKFFSNDARWQNVLHCHCCYHYVAFRSKSKGDKSTKGRKNGRKK